MKIFYLILSESTYFDFMNYSVFGKIDLSVRHILIFKSINKNKKDQLLQKDRKLMSNHSFYSWRYSKRKFYSNHVSG